MVLDVGNIVGSMNYIFLYNIEYSANFCNHLFIGEFGVSHCGPVLGRAAPLGGGTTEILADHKAWGKFASKNKNRGPKLICMALVELVHY